MPRPWRQVRVLIRDDARSKRWSGVYEQNVSRLTYDESITGEQEYDNAEYEDRLRNRQRYFMQTLDLRGDL